MDELQNWLDHAVRQHQAGQLGLAEPMYRRVLQACPEHLNAMYLLGTLKLQQGECAECIALLTQVAGQRDDIADVHNNLGVAYNGLSRWDEATRAFQRAIELRPDYQPAYFNLASLFETRGWPAQAEQYYRTAVELNPDDTQALFNLAQVLKSRGEWADAEDCYLKLLTSRLGEREILGHLGDVQVQQRRWDDAAETFEQLAAVQPGTSEIHCNLSFIYEAQGRLDAALTHAQRAVGFAPEQAAGFNNLGIALRALRRLDDAEAAFAQALTLRPDYPLAEFNLAATRLLRGNYRAGWPGYAARTRLGAAPPSDGPRFPAWDGRPLPGRRLLVRCEQGFGDALQFVRFLPAARRLAEAEIVLQCPRELWRLFSKSAGADVVIPTTSDPPDCAAEVALPGLPELLGVELADLPGTAPSLHADPELCAAWRERIHAAARGRRTVGLVWQGNPQQARDFVRSCPVDELEPLAEVTGVLFVNLQRTPEGAATFRLPSYLPLLDVAPDLVDFAETAAAVSALDLVLSVDTAVAHLAGSLGRPVWTWLGWSADWRWLLDRTDSPWYPTMRLLRQPAWGDWRTLVRETAAELERWAHQEAVTQSMGPTV